MNGHIDHTNYEAWLLDRLDGMLAPDQERELDAFLLLYPELVPIVDDLPTVTAIADQLSTAEKEALKRALPPTGPISRVNAEDHIIARLEGDLGAKELVALAAYLKEHPELQRVERLYTLTRSESISERFTGKQELERHFPPTSYLNAFTLTDHLIAQLEGDLEPSQEQALEVYLSQHQEARQQQRLVQAARIDPELLPYRSKAELKKGGRAIPIGAGRSMVRFAAAASIALLFGFGACFLLMRSPQATEIVQVPKNASPTITPATEATPDALAQTALKEPEGAIVLENPEVNNQQAPKPSVLPIKGSGSQMPVAPVEGGTPDSQPVPEHQELPQQAPKKVPDTTAPPVEQLAQVPERTPSTVRAMEQPTSLGGLLAATVRGTVLDETDRNTDPLNGDDAVAAVDRGLKVVGGHHSGLTVGRGEDGGVNAFQLRLGRKLGITASR